VKLIFTETDIAIIRHERRNNPHPRIRLRMEVLWLKHLGKLHEEIALITEVSYNTIVNYVRDFRKNGIEYLLENRFRKPESELDEHGESLKAYFLEHPPAYTAEAQAAIEERTGIRRCPTQIRKFMINIGMNPRKVGVIPAKADPEKQEEFKKNAGTAA
jgi:transposase